MKRFVLGALVVAGLAGLPGAVAAEPFERIEKKDGFLSVVKGRALTRLGIRLNVTENGKITGRAFGQKVTGDWNWQGGYFCRDLYVGGDELGANCQTVQVKGNTVRFTSDRGTGQFADLRLK